MQEGNTRASETQLRRGDVNGLAICAGIGGIELGLKRIIRGYSTVCYIEREAFAAADLVARMADETLDQAPIWDDLSSFDGRQWCGVVDIITAGFPCQPFSVAGPRRGIDDERWLWPQISQVIRDVKPSFIILENSKGIIAGLGLVLKTLAEFGYNAVWEVFSASQAGLLHIRERVFILAYSMRGGSIPFPLQEACEGEEILEAEDTLQQVFGIPRRGLTGRIRLFPDCGFRGMADGIPEKLERSERVLEADRLRCLGNAVVPACAALAVRTLGRRVNALLELEATVGMRA